MPIGKLLLYRGLGDHQVHRADNACGVEDGLARRRYLKNRAVILKTNKRLVVARISAQEVVVVLYYVVDLLMF